MKTCQGPAGYGRHISKRGQKRRHVLRRGVSGEHGDALSWVAVETEEEDSVAEECWVGERSLGARRHEGVKEADWK